MPIFTVTTQAYDWDLKPVGDSYTHELDVETKGHAIAKARLLVQQDSRYSLDRGPYLGPPSVLDQDGEELEKIPEPQEPVVLPVPAKKPGGRKKTS